MPIFESIPSEIEAEQFLGDRFIGDPNAPMPFASENAIQYDGECPYVQTAGGKANVYLGDWIAREPDGRGFYPIRPDIFAKRWRLKSSE